jgi:hypothetical protein
MESGGRMEEAAELTQMRKRFLTMDNIYILKIS